MDGWRTMGAAALGRGIAAGDTDPVDLCEAFLDAAAAHPDGPRIFARLTPERARAEASAARDRAKAGLRRGPLDGVPVSWKDNIDNAGTATEAGSALLAGRVPERDAPILAGATAQGSVCLGKTHLTELAFSGLGVNPITATPPNANDPALAPGGSSSGAAVSVALGLAAAAVGSDTGGSVRVPACWNDLVGFKTSHGLIDATGVVPLCESFDTVGPLTRTVEDAALMLALLGGPVADLRDASLSGTRIAVLETVALDDLRDAPARAFDHALGRLEAAGATLERITAPEVAESFTLAGPVFAGEAWGTWRHEIEAAPDKLYPPILDRFRGGAAFSAADYVGAWRRLHLLRRAWAARVAGYDAVAVPAVANLPPPVARLLEDTAYFTAENLLALRNTRIGNLMGLCGVTLPAGTSCCGIMLLGRAGGDASLLRIAAAAEAALG